jgi:hypothetical protein
MIYLKKDGKELSLEEQADSFQKSWDSLRRALLRFILWRMRLRRLSAVLTVKRDSLNLN